MGNDLSFFARRGCAGAPVPHSTTGPALEERRPRASLLASRNATASATSLLKATFGLSARNLNLDVEALFSQIDEIKGHPELISETFSSHPLLPIRLKALDLFSRSEKARRNGFPAAGPLLGDDELEDAVDDLVRLTRRFPCKPVEQAVMRTVALAGALLLSADGEVNPRRQLVFR